MCIPASMYVCRLRLHALGITLCRLVPFQRRPLHDRERPAAELGAAVHGEVVQHIAKHTAVLNASETCGIKRGLICNFAGCLCLPPNKAMNSACA